MVPCTLSQIILLYEKPSKAANTPIINITLVAIKEVRLTVFRLSQNFLL